MVLFSYGSCFSADSGAIEKSKNQKNKIYKYIGYCSDVCVISAYVAVVVTIASVVVPWMGGETENCHSYDRTLLKRVHPGDAHSYSMCCYHEQPEECRLRNKRQHRRKQACPVENRTVKMDMGARSIYHEVACCSHERKWTCLTREDGERFRL